MSWRSATATLAGLLLAAAALLFLFERQLSSAWFRLGLQPGVAAALERSLADRKALARLDPAGAAEYRRRFEEDQAVLQSLRILEHNRQEILRRYELILLVLVGAVLVAAGGLHLAGQRRRERRIERLRGGLLRLSRGEEVTLGDRGRDTLGRIAGMVEETSREVARDRRRLAALQNLSLWQETARRHAHEIRTPLTAARMELTRLGGMLEENGAEAPAGANRQEEARQAVASLSEELDRLGRFTRQFTSFARLPSPRPEVCDLQELVAEFATTFARAWPELELRLTPATSVASRGAAKASGGEKEERTVLIDRGLVRQALVNLCDNAAHALAAEERHGTITLRLAESPLGHLLEVADDGPGVPEEVRGRLFEPYVTSRQVGEGMGLGLAISKKILLDHGGDLELAETSPAGTTFRMLLPFFKPDVGAELASAREGSSPSAAGQPAPLDGPLLPADRGDTA